ncbi:MAG: DUF6798 domain-containing protein [Gammaproteobacteria bacterium]|nr:DUF6798 domain-containing protein [Gammaproteobacteria bacterium]
MSSLEQSTATLSHAGARPAVIRGAELAAVAVGAAVLLAFLGFVGVSADNTQYLLGAYERSDPGFLTSDWFVRGTESFHPLFEIYMAWWLALDQLVGGLLLWYLVNLVWLAFAVWMWLAYLGQRERPVLAMLLVTGMLLVGVRQGWGQYEILTGQALPAYLSYPPALMTLVWLCRRRYLPAACALVVTFFIHHGLGALLLLCLLGPFLLTLPRERKEVVQVLLGAALVGISFAGVVVGTLQRDGGNPADLMILFYGRSPHHYAIRFFDIGAHLATLHIFGAALLLASCLHRIEIRARLIALIATIAALCALGYVFLEHWYVASYVRLFPYRAIPLLVVINACLVAVILLDPSSRRRELGVVLLVVAAGVLFRFHMLLSLGLLAAAVAIRCLRLDETPAPRERRAVVTVAVVIGALSLVHLAVTRPPVFFAAWPPPFYGVLGEAFAAHTAPDDRLIVPPWLTGVRIATNRAIVVNTKSLPMYGQEMVEWAERMQAISGFDPRLGRDYLAQGADIWQLYSQGYQARSLADLLAAARRYDAAYILVTTGSRFHFEAQGRGLAPIWSSGGYALYRVADIA